MSRLSSWIFVSVAGLLTAPGGWAQTPAVPVATAPAVQATAAADGGTIHGTVKAGTIPLPGVAITATNTLTGKKFATTTDIDGNYSMTIAGTKTGRYVVKAELAAFAPVTHEVRLTAENANQTAEFALGLASRVAAADATSLAGVLTGTTAARGAGARGPQALNMTGLATGLEDATTAGVNLNGGTQPALGLGDAAGFGSNSSDAIVSIGTQGTTNPLANVSEDQLRERMNGAMDQVRAQGGMTGAQQNAVVSMISGIMGGGGGFGGPPGGGGGPGGQRGGGAFRNFNPAQPHGSVFYTVSNSALNASEWTASEVNGSHFIPNPSAYSNRFGVSLAGTPYIPGLTKPDTRQFAFINFTGQKNLNAFVPNPVRVPTTLERTGNFSQSFQKVNGQLTPVMLYDPLTGRAIANNNLNDPSNTTPISKAALNLLNLYPQPNIVTSDPTAYNYQTISNAGSNNVAINGRYQRQLGKAQAGGPGGRGQGGGGGGGGQRGQQRNAPPVLRQSINASYNYSHSASDNRNIFLALGGATESDGNAVNVGHTASYGRLSNNASLNWNRSSGETRNYFTDTNNNPSATAGICVPNGSGNSACGAGPATISDPRFYNGLPSIGITNFAGLSTQTPSKTINQTIAFSDVVSWRHTKHNYRFGVDIRRVHADSIGGNKPLGQFSFTGYATESPTDQALANGTASSGSGFADFLLGLPITTSIQAGLNKIYLRENVWDAYAQDDFRVKNNITLNYGLRYEYFAPYTEKNNRLANLDHNADFSQVDVVRPNANSTFGGTYPGGLVNPDHLMLSPRVGFAYSPHFNSKWSKNLVIRAGYGTNFNTGQFASAVRSLAFQPQFAQTQTNVVALPTAANPNPTASGCTTQSSTKMVNGVTIPGSTANVTLTHGFDVNGNTTGCSTANGIHNSYSIDKNYRLGMVQAYNLNIQKSLGALIVVNLGYNGSMGSNLDVVGSPNSTPNGNTLAGQASPFTFERSIGSSRMNQLVVSVQQRQHKGVGLGATYQYSHAIDDTSSIGGSIGAPVQNYNRVDLEEANSSFDQRHLLTGNWLLELPFGPNREFLNKGGVMAKVLDGFSLSGSFTFGSGNYFTPQYSGSTSEASSGNDYTQRPDRVFSQGTSGSGKLLNFFNAGAFVAPRVINGVTQFGTASRNSIEGPGTVSTNASLSKTIPLGGTNNFEARITASNVFNTVQYSGINTTVNSANYGQVTGAAGMRSVNATARYRF